MTAKMEKKKKKIDRGLTRHVVTRWYRSPEVILLQQQKEKLPAVDMWSVGCIFAELLQMQRENCPDPSRRGPLFPGDSSFPLSIKDQFDYASRTDQMQVIFEIIGTPSNEEIEKITDPKARKYLYGLPVRKPKNLKRRYPGATEEALDLLLRLLHFDVDKRITVDEALEHKYLGPVRDPNLEKIHAPVTFQFEDVALSMKSLRALILKEALTYNLDMKENFEKSGAMEALPPEIEQWMQKEYKDIQNKVILGGEWHACKDDKAKIVCNMW